ncbi:MAG: HAD-IIB family hydrolase, partial [Clostridia bacterium]|nr:HAD-IIB family hydrolase [Clostridia bacterium]
MKDLNYDLIISDFDGTLVSSDETVSEENKKAIEKYRENGGHFAISTGRLHYSILRWARGLGLKGLISCCQGAVIVNVEDGKRILDERLSYEATYTTVKKLLEMDKT